MSKIIKIENSELSVSVSTLGAELMSVSGKGGTEFLWNGDKNVWSGRAPLLFPICGGLKDDKFTYNGKEYTLPKHGFARHLEFEGEALSETKASFTLKSNADTLKSYPFEFVLTVTYELLKNSLNVTYSVKNPAHETMYFSIGSHEAYSCPEGIEEYEIEFDEAQTLDSLTLVGNLIGSDTVRVAENAKTLPLKYEYFETDALVFKNVKFNKAALTHKKSGKKVTVSFPGFENFLLWTIPGAKYICLEPWCGFPDIIGASENIIEKDSIIELAGKNEYTLSHTVTFEE